MKEQLEQLKPVVQTAWEKIKQPFRSKKGWILLVFFLVLLIVGGVVPVGKIPFLRNLAWAMGYTPDETKDISLLKALLSWNEHSKMMRGELPDPDGAGLFGNDGGFASARERLEAQKASNLINLRAVNASLAKQGQEADKLSGSYYSVDLGEGAPGADVRIRKGNAAANTEANTSKPGEVFFGSESGGLARDPKDGFDSVGALKKIANPNIAGGGSTDWLGSLVDKASKQDAGLEGVAKKLDTGGTLAQYAPITEIGDYRARRDMYYAWLTGMSARRTPQLVLKKTLASAGFDGSELPKKVFDSSGFSGIGINPDDVVSDLDNIKLRLKNEEDCDRALNSSGDALTGQLNAAKESINSLSGSFPKTCDEVDGSFTNRLGALRQQCEQVKNAYSELGTYCGVAVKSGREGTCTTNNLQERYDTYAGYCAAEKEKCQGLTTPEEQASCMGSIKKADDYDEGDCRNKGCSQDGVGKLVDGTFNVGVNGKPMDPNAGDFFPEADWGGSKFY